MELTWGLEYLVLFGPPKNKVEVLDGRTRLVFPFLEREGAERHFAGWTEALSRWLDAAPSAVEKDGDRWRVEVGDATLTLFPRPIELQLPLHVPSDMALSGTFWRRDFWPGQPAGLETGWDHFLDHQDVALNVWRLCQEVRAREGGRALGRVELVLDDHSVVAPDQYYFRPGRQLERVGGEWYRGAPDLVAEVLSPVTRAVDRGPRMELYRRAGVPFYWLLDPLLEEIEEYELLRQDYRRVRQYRVEETFEPRAFPGLSVPAATLFDTQMKRHGEPRWREEPAEPVPHWLVPPERRLGLEYLMLLGQPHNRREIWDDRSPCLLAFGSEEEARLRLRHLLEEACRWEGVARVEPRPAGGCSETARVGRFHFERDGRRVTLRVAVDSARYRLMLEACASRDAWDWGEDEQ
jgi:Putative restriction endonuclease